MSPNGSDDGGRESPSGALARGLAVLSAVNDLETATVTRIVSETALPKATVIRLLHTLQAEGYIAQDPDTMTYWATPKVVSLSRAVKGDDEITGLVQIALDMLADRIKWPVEYLVVDGLSMLVQSNNRERAPIKLKLFERRRFPILGSASGVAHLATLPAEDCARMLDRILTAADSRAEAEATVAKARSKGYAMRSLTELGPNMAVASVALPSGGGALSLVHFDDVVSVKQLETVMLPELRICADNIVNALRRTYPR